VLGTNGLFSRIAMAVPINAKKRSQLELAVLNFDFIA